MAENQINNMELIFEAVTEYPKGKKDIKAIQEKIMNTEAKRGIPIKGKYVP